MRSSIQLQVPKLYPSTSFHTVLIKRRSGLGGPCEISSLAPLLWHACRVQRRWPPGRAGIRWEWRAAPSSGGLHPIEIICIPAKSGQEIFRYDPKRHALDVLECQTQDVIQRNSAELLKIFGGASGVTLQMVADLSKVAAAYTNPLALVLRDAGCLVSIISLCATWLGYASCPIGRLGTNLLKYLALPPHRYVAVGGVQITASQ